MNLIKLSDVSKVVPVYMADATTKAGRPGLTLAVNYSKNGAAFAAAATPSVLDLGNGFYSYTPASGVVDTLGPLVFRVTGAGADDYPARYTVVGFDPYSATNLGLANLDAAVSSRSVFAGGAVASVAGSVGSVTAGVTVAGYAAGQDPAAQMTAQGYTTARAPKLDQLDAAVSTRSVYAGGAVASVSAGVNLAAGAVSSASFTFSALSAQPAGLLEQLRLLFYRFFPPGGGSVTLPKSGNGSLVVKTGASTTLATQAVADDGTVQTLNPAG